MKKKYLFEELLMNKKGSSTLLSIFLITGILIFIFLPMSAILFEKFMLSLLFESMEASIELNAYQIYQNLQINDLSQGIIKISDDALFKIEGLLLPLMQNPQLEEFDLLSITQNNDTLLIKGKMKLKTSLYRKMYGFQENHEFNYYLELPMDKKKFN